MWAQIFRFLRHPRKPAILALCRPDAKKNLPTLLRAYGESPALRELANLVLVMGNRDDLEATAAAARKTLEGVLRLVDGYDLYGSVAYPKHHAQAQVTDIYRYAAATRGVFVNIALQACPLRSSPALGRSSGSSALPRAPPSAAVTFV